MRSARLARASAHLHTHNPLHALYSTLMHIARRTHTPNFAKTVKVNKTVTVFTLFIYIYGFVALERYI